VKETNVSYMPPSPTPPHQAQSSSNRTLWIILGSIGVVGVCSLLCLGVAVFGILTALGQRTSTVFEQIQNDLDAESQFQLPTAQPVDLGAAIPIGTAKRIGNLEITVTDATTIDGQNGIEPEEYYQFVAVRLRIQNSGTQPVSLESIGPWSWIHDSDDFTYDCCVFALSDSALLNDELAAGSSIEGELVYEAADDGSSLFWVFEESESGEQMVVRLEQLTAETDIARLQR
jgi:hypothetical protein